MISLKKYLDQKNIDPAKVPEADADGLLPTVVAAYRSALRAMGNSTVEACPVVSEDLKRRLGRIENSLTRDLDTEKVESAERAIEMQLQEWGRNTARHYRQKTDDVKEILIVMARTAESVGQRDQRCASQISGVTARLKQIATLEDLSQIRSSLEANAAELKTSIDRMTAEGKAAIEHLQAEVSLYQARLEEAEHIASSDSLTGLRSRLWIENYLERRKASTHPFCIVIIDIDEFKRVNDDYGHPVGDELLQQFANELRSACRTSDIVGRWGGDEFIVILDCDINEARTQTVRLKQWICGNYTLQGRIGPEKLPVEASFGLAAYIQQETIKMLLSRADTDMYQQKAASRASVNGDANPRPSTAR